MRMREEGCGRQRVCAPARGALSVPESRLQPDGAPPTLVDADIYLVLLANFPFFLLRLHLPANVRAAYADKTSARHANSHPIVNACLVADVDSSGTVTRCSAAFGGLLAAWGLCDGCPEDLNGDGQVSGADIGLLLSVWGLCP